MTRETSSLLAVLAVTSLIGCGGGIAEQGGPKGPLPPYTARQAQLFDDGIEPRAVGYAGTAAGAFGSDDLLRDRTQAGDGVVRARVVTVTLRHEDSGQSWQVGLHTLEVLAGAHPPPSEFTLQVESSDPAAGMMRALETQLVGMSFVAFVREFQRPPKTDDPPGAAAADGASAGPPIDAWHFHLARDDKDEIDSVRAAKALGEVR